MTTYGLPPEPPVGLHQKYTVTRNDGQDRPGARYFVINYAADPAAMAALAAYADAVESDNPKLAADLRTLIEPEPSDMNPDDIATETIMPEAFLDLAREMVAQKSPEAAATAALAWALRHAPVDGGALEIAGHRIERIAPERPTASLIVATLYEKRCVFGRDEDGNYDSPTGGLKACANLHHDSLTNVVPVRVVPVAEWEAMKSDHRTRSHIVDGCHICALIAATDALGVAEG